jgi:branched-chain amino acid transport system ATP-binding protein
MSILKISNMSISFGGLTALSDISFELNKGQIFSIIGPNGAGKTTIFNCISGNYRPNSGKISFNGINITKKKPDKVAKLGIARTFQNIELFSHMTAIDNILLTFTEFMAKEEIKNREVAEEIIDFLDLQSARNQFVINLPYGTRKLVELGRALAMSPEIMMLDEPSAGMNLEEREDLKIWIKDIRDDFGITIIIVEHDMNLVMNISDEIMALNFGKKIAQGKPEEIQKHPEVIKAYLGEEAVNE